MNQCSLSATPETWQPLDLENDPPRLTGMYNIHVQVNNLGNLKGNVGIA